MSTTTTTRDLTGPYTLDASHSRLGFVARHAMVTKVRGAFTDISGDGHFDPEDPANTTATVTVRAASIDTGNGDRDGHVRSADFLDVEAHPEIRFAASAVQHLDGDTYRMTGDLTIKDVTRPITIDLDHTGAATDPFGNERIGFEGSAQLSRKDFGLTWNAPLEAGGVLVGDKVTLELDLSAIRQDG